MFSSSNFICKTWMLIFCMNCFTKYLFSKGMKIESFTESSRNLAYLEKTELMLVCDPPNTTDWAAILHEDKVLVNSSTKASNISYHFPSLSCNNFGYYFCVANTTQQINMSVIGCPPQLCLPHKKLLTADLGLDVMFDICVMVPSPITGMPLKISYKNTWLDKGQCESRLCVTWTSVEMYRFNINITIANVSEDNYGEIKLMFGSSYSYENYSINYSPILVPTVTCMDCSQLKPVETACYLIQHSNIAHNEDVQKCWYMSTLNKDPNFCFNNGLKGADRLFVILGNDTCGTRNNGTLFCDTNNSFIQPAVICQNPPDNYMTTPVSLLPHLFMYAGITVGMATIVILSTCLFILLSRKTRKGKPRQPQIPSASDGIETENPSLSEHNYSEYESL